MFRWKYAPAHSFQIKFIECWINIVDAILLIQGRYSSSASTVAEEVKKKKMIKRANLFAKILLSS